MQPSTLSVQELFEKERRYIVPLFQRAYVWTQVAQWEPLWDDVEDLADEAINAIRNGTSMASTHFLGAIVLNVAKVVGRGISRSEIIDGQQRLTTLQVLLAAFRDYAETLDRDLADKVRRLTRNPGSRLEPAEKLKVWPTNADRESFDQVMNTGSLDKLRAAFAVSGTPKIGAAYLFFFEKVANFAEGLSGDDELQEPLPANEQIDRLEALYHALQTALQFVVIELEERDDPQIIFETLNARGQPLLPSDLIRNFIFLQASNEADVDQLYNFYWKDFDERQVLGTVDRFWQIEERQGRLTRPRLDLFIFHYLTVKTERDLKIGELFREFRRWRDKEHTTVEAFLKELKTFSRQFERLIEPAGTGRVAEFARRLKSLDTSTVYPVALFLLTLPPDILPPTKLVQILTDIESYLVRRFVCHLTNKNYNRLFVSLLAALREARDANKDLAMTAREYFLALKGPAVFWPNDQEFMQGWLSKPIYVSSRSDRAAMILRALEENIRTSRNEPLEIPRSLTVEHLLPQTADPIVYPFSKEVPLANSETFELRRERLTHTMGNLTLLTQALNSAIGNGPFRRKCEEIGKDSDLRLNASFRGVPRDTWSESDILENGERRFAYATEIWPRPVAS
jgi:uncharacterized protein with ParB-like and HNH nuclease domain